MFVQERREKILEYLKKHKTVTVNYLSKAFSVSKECIRQDLNVLSQNGELERHHGGATFKKKILKHELGSKFDIQKTIKNKALNRGGILGNDESNKVCVIGSFCIDIVAKVAYFPNPNEKIIAIDNVLNPGGKGANQAIAASRAGGYVHFIAKVGNDDFNQFAYDHLSSSDISSFKLFESEKESTGTAIIYVSEDTGESMIAVKLGANKTFTSEEVLDVEYDIKNAKILLIQLGINLTAIVQIINIARINNITVILEPSPYAEEIKPYLHLVDIITPNMAEASLLSNIDVVDIPSAKKAAQKIKEYGVNTVIITMGEHGVLAFINDSFYEFNAYPVLAIDSTGMSDAFNGCLAASLASGRQLLSAIDFSIAFASLSSEREGASNMPNHKEVERYLTVVKQHK